MHDDPTLPLGDSPSPAAGMPEARDQWGPFRLLARVGAGGFGEVYRAWDPNLEREVALKLLLPGAVGGDEEYRAMLREARAMASVQHENIVHVYGIDRHDGRVGFWTDFVKGKTLSALLGMQGPFGYREAALIGIDVSRALSAVHRASLLHRDIKAENVMREEGGRILLMDFGLSVGERTIMTQLAGTPNYMAPELFDGGKASVCTDIYAMGVLLYYLVIGDYPARLTGLTLQEAKIALGHRRPLMDLRSDLPEPFLRTVRIAMELDPAKRFASAGLLAESLAECLGSGFAPTTPAYAPTYAPAVPAYTPTYAPTTPAYTPNHPPAYAPVSSPPSGSAPPPPKPAPPPPKPPFVEPASWANLFGLIRGRKLSKRAKWALLGLTIFAFQKWWRTDEPTRHKSSVSAPAAPGTPAADSDDNSDSSDDAAAAIATGLKAVSLNPRDHTFWANLANAYQWSGKQDKALDAYAKAIEFAEAQRSKTPNDPNLLGALAVYYASSNMPDKSLPLLRKSLALAPKNPEVVFRAGEAYELLGQRPKAIPLIVEALASGYDATEFQLNPRLASLRDDPAIKAALAKAKENSKE